MSYGRCCRNPPKSPVIPLGYDRIAQWQINKGHLTREQLAMVSVLMSRQAVRHPLALTRKPHDLERVLTAPQIGNVTNLLECARRADGGAAIIVASSRFIRDQTGSSSSYRLNEYHNAPVIISGGEASGPLFPPDIIDEEMFSCEEAVKIAYDQAQLGAADIQFFGLYDCFPICFLRALEAVQLTPKYGAGKWVEEMYRKSESNNGVLSPSDFPVNTHGGLLAFGAPWETPAMYNVIEAVAQLRGQAKERQVPHCRRALVYGNGGIFSASAVAILGRGNY